MSMAEFRASAVRQLRELADAIESGEACPMNLEHESTVAQLAPLSDDEWVVRSNTGEFCLSVKYARPNVEQAHARRIMERAS